MRANQSTLAASPVYTAGRGAAAGLGAFDAAARSAGEGGAGAGEKGLALRFPRFVRERPDKSAAEATTAAELVSAFKEMHGGGEEEEGQAPDD